MKVRVTDPVAATGSFTGLPPSISVASAGSERVTTPTPVSTTEWLKKLVGPWKTGVRLAPSRTTTCGSPEIVSS
ncbi:MAG TPA: hypothetical protein VGS61_06600 [Acidimicrobiales bacterium]|nr:hypothetical protein [Acidimicrobiales bacterium]